MTINQIFLLLIFPLVAATVAIGALLFVSLKQNRGRMERALNMSLFLITLPKKVRKSEGEPAKSEKEIISVMEQLYASLNNIRETKDTFFYGQPHLVFEIATPYIGEDISFYMAMPRRYAGVIEKQIHGFYPEASVEAVEDYNIFSSEGETVGSYFKLNQDHVLPFRTYQQLEKDPLNEITNALSKIEEEGEGVALQFIVRPASAKKQKLGLSVAKKMQEGKSFSQAKSEAGGSSTSKLLGETAKSLVATQKEGAAAEKKTEVITPGQQEIIKALENKANKINFDVNFRAVVSASSKARAEELLNHLETAFVQFNAPNLNGLKATRAKGRGLKKLIYNFSFRLFNQGQNMLLSTEELASLFHFPSAATETPKVKFLKAETSSPPVNLPKEGVVLGKNVYRGTESIVRLMENDRRRHLYVIGQTGVGKSVFLRNLIVQDIREGKGVAVLDPTGDIEKILAMVPKERVDDVVLIDPADMERPIGLNMLEYDPKHPEQKTFIVNEFISIFDKLYDLKATGGPIFEQYARNAMMLLMDDPEEQNTIMEIPRILSDRDFRLRLLKKCRNIVVKDFWEKEAEKAGGDASLQNMVPYITSKFNTFVANDYMRPIIGQSKSSFNFRQIMDERKILLADLSKGRLGDINSHLLGMIITGKILAAALSRVDIPEDERKDFYLYIDEFQNFTTESIETILSEARKYRLCLTVAHQFIGQLTDKIKGAIFGNVGSVVAFRVGSEDAEFLVKQFEPVFDTNDLINIDNFNAYIKLMIQNQTSKPFSMTTIPPEAGDLELAASAKSTARQKYGRDREKVEAEIMQRWRGPAANAGSSEASPAAPEAEAPEEEAVQEKEAGPKEEASAPTDDSQSPT